MSSREWKKELMWVNWIHETMSMWKWKSMPMANDKTKNNVHGDGEGQTKNFHGERTKEFPGRRTKKFHGHHRRKKKSLFVFVLTWIDNDTIMITSASLWLLMSFLFMSRGQVAKSDGLMIVDWCLQPRMCWLGDACLGLCVALVLEWTERGLSRDCPSIDKPSVSFSVSL